MQRKRRQYLRQQENGFLKQQDNNVEGVLWVRQKKLDNIEGIRWICGNHILEKTETVKFNLI